MKVMRSIRAAALFVGSVVGAGFATGREVMLFFGADGVGSLFVASLFMAICVFAFMEIGARRALSSHVALVTDTLVSFSSLAVYAAMIAAAEKVLAETSGQSGLSLLLAALVGLLSMGRSDRLAGLNLLAVPFMVAVIVYVGVRSAGRVEGGFHLLTPLAYGGMNLLFSGALMVGEGEKSTLGERVLASLISGAVIFLMLLFMRRCLVEGADMPFLVAAREEGVGTLAGIALLLAIVTTMASCAYLVIGRLSVWTGDPLLSASLVTLVGVLLSSFGFAPIVNATYPVVSYLGLAATLFALGYTLFKGCGFWQKIPFRKPPSTLDSGKKT